MLWEKGVSGYSGHFLLNLEAGKEREQYGSVMKGQSVASEMNGWKGTENKEVTAETSFPNSFSEIPGFLWNFEKIA